MKAVTVTLIVALTAAAIAWLKVPPTIAMSLGILCGFAASSILSHRD